MERKPFERLPTNIIPKHYAVDLNIALENHTFDGQVAINVVVNQATKSVILNASELVLSEVMFQGDRQLLKPTKVTLNATDETVQIEFESPLEVGEGMLEL